MQFKISDSISCFFGHSIPYVTFAERDSQPKCIFHVGLMYITYMLLVEHFHGWSSAWIQLPGNSLGFLLNSIVIAS